MHLIVPGAVVKNFKVVYTDIHTKTQGAVGLHLSMYLNITCVILDQRALRAQWLFFSTQFHVKE